MWFKNLCLFQLPQSLNITPEQLSQKLAEAPFKPCGSQELKRSGWVPPVAKDATDYIHAQQGYLMLCARRQEKLLPSTVVKEQLEERLDQIRNDEDRPVGRKERQTLKDEVIVDLLPRAFSKSARDYAYIATRDDLILVDSASANRAEDLLSQLRETLGSLKAIPLTPQQAPAQVMTHWLHGEPLPADFVLGEECELRASKDERVVRLKNLDLSSPEVANHLDTGMYVSKLALTWKEAIHFVLDDNFMLKRLKFEDALQEQASARNPESAAETFDADFAVMSLELTALVKALLQALGGKADA